MKRSQLFLSALDGNCAAAASSWGLGLELTQFCTAFNIDQNFTQMDEQIRNSLAPGQGVIYHGPYNELFPCAIDPKARELAAMRYRQAIALAKTYGASKVVIHGAYHPWIYFPEWFVEQSVVFWEAFLKEDPGVQIVLENVLEPEPEWLLEIVKQVDHPEFRLCLDVGHVNAYSGHGPIQWLEHWAPWISHFHIHNNDGSWDTHSGLDQGTVDMGAFLSRAEALCPEATYTLELTDAQSGVAWLAEHGFIFSE